MLEEDRLWIQRSSVGMHLLVVALVPLLPLIIIRRGVHRKRRLRRAPAGVASG